MSDDPRQILAEAGVECAEVEELMDEAVVSESWEAAIEKHGWDAILALARLVAKYKADWELTEEGLAFWMECDQEHEELAEKYKWQRDTLIQDDHEYENVSWFEPETRVADLERRWSER